LLLDPDRYRLESSSSGIGSSFRVPHPRKYRHYCFCDPVLPLAPCPGCTVFPLRAAAGDCLGYRPRPLSGFALPLECYPAIPTRSPQRSGPLMGFGSLQHLRNPRSTLHGPKPARYVPPSGFDYPLDGLRPRIPCRFCFTPAALLGFTLRRFPLPKGFTAFQPGRTHLPLARRCSRRRSVGPARRASVSGFMPSRIALQPCGVLSRQPPAPPLGFTPLGHQREGLAPDSSGTPLTCLASPDGYPPDQPASQSVGQPSLCSPRHTPKCIPDRATLMGFLHLPAPDHSGSPMPGLWNSPPAESHIAADLPTIFGHRINPAEAAQPAFSSLDVQTLRSE
jgi:hypothetical protein